MDEKSVRAPRGHAISSHGAASAHPRTIRFHPYYFFHPSWLAAFRDELLCSAFHFVIHLCQLLWSVPQEDVNGWYTSIESCFLIPNYLLHSVGGCEIILVFICIASLILAYPMNICPFSSSLSRWRWHVQWMMSNFHPSLLRWFYSVRRMYIHFLTFIALDLSAACSIQDECVASVTFFICHPFVFQLLWLEPRMINIHRALCFSSHRLSSLPRRKCLCALAIVVRRRWRQRWCCWKSSCRKKIVSSTF